MSNISLKSEYACSGCGACAAVCPKNAIGLELDEAGFFVASVDAEKCVDCGLCVKTCTRFDESIGGVNLHDAELFALQSADEKIVKSCSSGGLAHELAVQALADGCKVVGAAYNTETDRAEHIIIDSTEQLNLLDGSKYIQSNTSMFRDVITEAKNNPKTEFAVFGTPCQIAGVAKATELLGMRDRFLLTEIFCHGVPSYKLWDAQCETVRKKLGTEKFDSVQFRYKKNDWHSYCLRVDAQDKTFYGAREKELFWQVFFENVLLGDSCMTCRARKEDSLADLRLGDYWGGRFQKRSDGVSAVFACTERGKAAIGRLCESGVLTEFEQGDANEMLAAQNMAGYHNIELHNEAMAKLRESGNVMEAVKLYRAKSPAKQKAKRVLLRASAILPDDLRAELRKANSSRQLKK